MGEKESKHAVAGLPKVPGGHAALTSKDTLSMRKVPGEPVALKARMRTASEAAPITGQGSAALTGVAAKPKGTEKLPPNASKEPSGPVSEYCSCATEGPVLERCEKKLKFTGRLGSVASDREKTGPMLGSAAL